MVAECMLPAPPPLIIIQPPGGPHMVGLSPASSQPQRALKFGCSGEKPGGSGGGAPACAPPLLAPPPLRRQNASRFSWPPDVHQEWCYISLSPADLVEQCERVLSLSISEREVAEVFCCESAADAPAYLAYATRYRAELAEILSR